MVEEMAVRATELLQAVTLMIPPVWQVRFNASGIKPMTRIAEPVLAAILDELLAIAEFCRAYEPDSLASEELETYGATLREFIGTDHEFGATIRDFVLPNPDSRP